MKVTSSNNPELNTNNKIDRQSAGNEFDAPAIDGLMPGATSEKSDFAGVLDKVTRSHNESTSRHAERSSDEEADTREFKTREKDKLETDVVAGTEQPLTRETVSTPEVNTDSRPVLHTADIDSIVTACHVQLATNGQQTVTLDLSRSMLDGLRVKISADASGRITADFLAANEGIKSLLDNRSSELLEQLRSRGINVAEFKSSVTADANDRSDSRREQQPTPGGERIADGIAAVASQAESEAVPGTEDTKSIGATYRA
jgi:hypothetical protein